MSSLSLDQLITEACEIFAPADSPTRYYSAGLSHAAAFRRAYIRNNAKEIRTAYLQVGPERSADLPDDYVNWKMLGLTFPGWATVRNLSYNGHLPIATVGADYQEDSPLVPPTQQEVLAAAYGDIDADSSGYCGFGAPIYADEFRIDGERNRIVCSSRIPESAILVLEYTSHGTADGEDIAIDALAHDWGLNFLLEKLYAQKKDWNTVTYYKAEAMKAHDNYVADKRTFGVGNVIKAKRAAARQRWK